MQQLSAPRITVIIPCYNQGHYLGDAVASVLAQTCSGVEVIVVDDGSTDDTARVAQSYGDPVRCIQKANAGLAAARNTGLLQAQGEFVLFLDADDYLRTEMLERQMAAVAATPAGDVFHGAVELVNAEGQLLEAVAARPLGADPFHALFVKHLCACHSLLIRRSAFADAGIFDVALRACEDWDMWLRLAAAGARFVAVPDAIAVYRKHDGSMSADFERMWQSGRQVLRKSMAYHGHCRLCRRAVGGATQWYGRWCGGLWMSELEAANARGETWSTLVKAGRASVRTPVLGWLLLSELRRGARPWRMLRTLRGSRGRHRLKRA